MAIEDIVGPVLDFIVQAIGAAGFKNEKSTKKQKIGWIIVFLLVALLLWFIITSS